MRTLIFLLTALGLIACPTTDDGDFWDEGDDDDAAPDDDDDATEPGDDDDATPELGEGGRFGIWYWELPSPDPSDPIMAGGGFIASFWEDISWGTPGTPVNGEYEWDSPSGADDCIINVYDEADLETTGGTPGVQEERDAGLITVTSPDWTIEVDPWPNTEQQSQYYYELEPALPTLFDTFYEVTVEGGQFPAFTSSAELLVYDALHLTNPATADWFELDGNDLDLTWDGGSADEIWIEVYHGETFELDNAIINCIATNDGEFTIPGTLIDQLPMGTMIQVFISQPRSDWITVGDVEVDVGSGASASAYGERI